jgi:phenylacetate-coenzyme A ligase PaaK-like adenylate-forming protein
LAVRICQAAKKKGIDLTGAEFFLTAEPTTEAKQKEINSSGGGVFTLYAFTEAGIVGLGCMKPVSPDNVHICKDSVALIQHPREVPHAATSVDAFLFSTLLSTAPKILLNVESGDYGVVKARNCGCRWEEVGLMDHIYNIGGFDKLTSEGMTFIGTDLVRIIEDVLPAKFGGASTDYQVVEEEDEKGYTRMSVIVSPELGEIDEAELIKTILDRLSRGTDTERMMAQVWAQAKTLRVQRRQPFITARGKLMPLHIDRHKKAED